MKRRKLFVLLVIIVGVILTITIINLLPGSSAAESKKDPVTDRYQVTKPVLMDTAYSVEYVADIQSIQHNELRARVQGYIEKIYADEGQSVKKGDLLFNISDHEYRAELLKASALLKNSLAEVKAVEVECRTTKDLVDKKIVSETQLELAHAKLEALNAKVEEARSQEAAAKFYLAYTHITAPFNGIIGRIPNKIGSLVEEGALLTTISDNSKVYAYFNVAEKDYLDHIAQGEKTLGQSVTLVLANNGLYPLVGKLESVDNKVNKETGNISFRASFPNPDLLLKHGSTGKVRLRKEIKNALIIPQVATVENQDRISVFAVDSDNIVRRKSITIKLRLPNIYIIESGLAATDRIIYKGLQFIHEGDKVDSEIVTFLPSGSDVRLVSSIH